MKRFLFFTTLFICNISAFSQTTQNPHVERNKNHGARISWVDCTSTDQTIVGIDFTNVFYWYSWVAITPNTYIEYINPTTGMSETKNNFMFANSNWTNLKFWDQVHTPTITLLYNGFKIP